MILDTTATGFLLVDPTRGGGNPILDLACHGFEVPGTPCALPRAAGDVWGDGRAEDFSAPYDPTTALTVAADAADGLQETWDYYARIHGRDGWDDRGTTTPVRIHFADDRADLIDNAFTCTPPAWPIRRASPNSPWR